MKPGVCSHVPRSTGLFLVTEPRPDFLVSKSTIQGSFLQQWPTWTPSIVSNELLIHKVFWRYKKNLILDFVMLYRASIKSYIDSVSHEALEIATAECEESRKAKEREGRGSTVWYTQFLLTVEISMLADHCLLSYMNIKCWNWQGRGDHHKSYCLVCVPYASVQTALYP